MSHKVVPQAHGREFWIKLSSSPLAEPLMGLIIGPWFLLLLCCAWIVILRPNDRAGSAGEAPGAKGEEAEHHGGVNAAIRCHIKYISF